jgi:hypothetical protein
MSNFFERTYVINLDRRPDRWKQVSDRLARAQINATRFSASDARDHSIANDYQEYLRAEADDELPASLLNEDEVYRSGDHALRIRSLREHWNAPPIKTAGAYAYPPHMEANLGGSHSR